MQLSSDLISQFAKITNDTKETKTTATVYGTVVKYNGSDYVKLDGSDLLTPVNKTTSTSEGDRVTVSIGDHTATITGNISDPAASSNKVSNIGNQIAEFEIVIADKVSTKEFDAEVGRIDELVSDNATIKGKLTATEAEIDTLQADNVTINEKLTANEASIEKLEATQITADILDAKYATIENLEVTNQKVYNLDATYGEFEELTTKNFEAVTASIEQLDTEKLTATEADLKYANIDFSNIGEAAMEYFYANSGLIRDVTIGNGSITGELIGVTIKGDLIEGNTIIADKLVIKGDDGVYYKLNTSIYDNVYYSVTYNSETGEYIVGERLETAVEGNLVVDAITTDGDAVYSYVNDNGEELYYCKNLVYNDEKVNVEEISRDQLNGQVIVANSITAEKIAVDDLVAFDATIGGFNITESAIYSGVKESIDNTTQGMYMDNDGQLSFGDSNNYIKYYQNEDGSYSLDVAASSVLFGNGNLKDLVNAIRIDSNAGTITIGLAENSMSLTLKNDTISFEKNGEQFGWWDGVDFHTGNIIVDVNERAQFGNFAFIPRSDGSLSFLKVGG